MRKLGVQISSFPSKQQPRLGPALSLPPSSVTFSSSTRARRRTTPTQKAAAFPSGQMPLHQQNAGSVVWKGSKRERERERCVWVRERVEDVSVFGSWKQKTQTLAGTRATKAVSRNIRVLFEHIHTFVFAYMWWLLQGYVVLSSFLL